MHKHCLKQEPGFCPDCGSLLPMLGDSGGVVCYTCKHLFGPEVFGTMECSYVVQFNSHTRGTSKQKQIEDVGGPVVERRCPKCDNEKMSYATLQLRSADEGQTVFYTCTTCHYKETENS